MAGMNCPSCNARMEKVTEPDITTDVCQNCSAIFLDKGEVNALATALAGDIEYCSIDQDRHKENHRRRQGQDNGAQNEVEAALPPFEPVDPRIG